MNIIGIIPGRMAATRFPGKPLAKILDLPMVEHVYHRSAMAKSLKAVYVATCDQEIMDAVKAFGGKAIMTKDTHERASDRVAEAMLKAEKDLGEKVDIVVMIQGDEPMVFPEMIEKSVEPLINDKNILVANLMAPIKSEEELQDFNCIKTVVDQKHFALYFSRQAIPAKKGKIERPTCYKQVCIIPFQRDFLIKFNELPQTPLEISESVDMLRVLEHGYRVKMVLTNFETYSVDTHEDLVRVEQYLQNDPLIKKYPVKVGRK